MTKKYHEKTKERRHHFSCFIGKILQFDFLSALPLLTLKFLALQKISWKVSRV